MAVDVAAITQQLNSLSSSNQKEILTLLNELSDARSRIGAQNEFLLFIRKMWPAFIEGSHHKVMADAFNRIADGSLKRLIINMPPRHTKSEFASHFFPAWYLGRYQWLSKSISGCIAKCGLQGCGSLGHE